MDEITTLTTQQPNITGFLTVQNSNGEWRRNRYYFNPETNVRGAIYSSDPINNPLEIAALNAGATVSTSFISSPLITVAGVAITPLRLGLAFAGYKFFKGGIKLGRS